MSSMIQANIERILSKEKTIRSRILVLIKEKTNT